MSRRYRGPSRLARFKGDASAFQDGASGEEAQPAFARVQDPSVALVTLSSGSFSIATRLPNGGSEMLLQAPRFLSNGYIFHLLFGPEFHNPMQIGAPLELCELANLMSSAL